MLLDPLGLIRARALNAPGARLKRARAQALKRARAQALKRAQGGPLGPRGARPFRDPGPFRAQGGP